MSEGTGRVVIVAGAAGSLGQSVARAFEATGARLALWDRSVEALEAAFGAASDTRALAAVDLTDQAAAEAAAAEARETFGRVDVLVNVVGGFTMGTPLAEDTWDDWARMHTLNVKTAFVGCRAVVPILLDQGEGGAVVNVASASAGAGSATQGAYIGAKAALMRLTESLSAEVCSAGVRVNAVMPAAMDTPPNRDAMPDNDTLVDTAAVADVVVFLASDGARAVHGVGVPVVGLQ